MLYTVQSVLSRYMRELETTPLWTQWRQGAIETRTYATVLYQLYRLHLAVEQAAGAHDPFHMFSPDLIQSDVLRGDLYILARAGVPQPQLMPRTADAVNSLIPTWGRSIPERLLAVTWLLEAQRQQMLQLFGGTVHCLNDLPGSKRGMDFMRQSLSEPPVRWRRLQRRFAERMTLGENASQCAVGLVHGGGLILHIYRTAVPDSHATRG
jgi:hypothetical protein